MADKKVTDLTLLTSADTTDVVPIVDVSANTTKRTTVAGLAAAVASSLPASSVGGSALTTYRITRQNNTTNSTDTAAKIITGWGFITGTGSSFATKSIAFGTTFSSAPTVTVSCIGYKDGSDPSSISDFGAWEIPYVNASALTTTGFNATFRTVDGSAVGTSRRIGFSWTAIGS